MPVIFGRNPVLEALESDQTIDKIYLLNSAHGEVIKRLYRLARQMSIPVVRADRRKLQQLCGSGNHQGVAALVAPVNYLGLEDLVEHIQRQGETPALVVADRIQDPHNLGAIIRSAEALGMHGLIFDLRDSVPITDTVVKASAGAVFHLNICKVNNLTRAVRYLKDCGLWVYASSSHAEKTLAALDLQVPLAVIIGSEGKGVCALLQQSCDEQFRIPLAGKTESLNASVAAGIIFYEIQRQRHPETFPA